MGKAIPVRHSVGTAPDLNVTLPSCVKPHNVSSLQHLGANLIHSWCLATGKLLVNVTDLCQGASSTARLHLHARRKASIFIFFTILCPPVIPLVATSTGTGHFLTTTPNRSYNRPHKIYQNRELRRAMVR